MHVLGVDVGEAELVVHLAVEIALVVLLLL